jgi:hypothetical protein
VSTNKLIKIRKWSFLPDSFYRGKLKL